MIQIIEQAIKQSALYYSLRNWWVKRGLMKKVAEWERKGRPVPPPRMIKQQTLLRYARKYKLKVLVETGTYFGDTVDAMKSSFDHIYSIELSKELYSRAKERFKNARNIELIHGDSGKELRNIVNKINQPALFWLDGHYSAGVTARGEKDTPIYEELNHILGKKDTRHVIIIDDARSFGSTPNYPSIEEIIEFIKSKKKNVDILVQDDSIRITPT